MFRCTNILTIGLVLLLSLNASSAQAQRPDLRWYVGGHAFGVTDLHYSLDGTRVVSSGSDGTTKVWEAKTGRLLHTITSTSGQNFAHLGAIFSPDSSDIITAGTGGAYRWRLSDGTFLNDYCCMETGLDAAYSPNGELLAVGGSISGLEEDTRIFNAADGTLVDTFTFDTVNYVFAALFTLDGETLITGAGTPFQFTDPGVIRFIRISDGTETHVIHDHSSRVNALALSPDGTMLASASDDTTVRLWNVADASPIRTITMPTAGVLDVTFSPDGQRLAATDRDGFARIFDVATGAQLLRITAHDDAAGAVAWSPDGKEILTGGGTVFGVSYEDAHIRAWDPKDGTLLRQFTEFVSTAESIARSNDGLLVAVATADHTIQIRSALDGSLIRTIQAPGSPATVAFSPDATILASGGYDDNVSLWRVSNGTLIRTLTGHSSTVGDVAFSPDGSRLASACWDDPIHLWNVTTGALVDTYGAATPSNVAFSPDGTRIAGGDDNLVYVWNLSSGVVEHTLAGHSSSVRDVSYAPDGQRLASASVDRTVRIWDLSTGMLEHVLTHDASWANTVAFAPDGETILSAGGPYGRAMFVWQVSDGALLVEYLDDIGTSPNQVVFSPSGRHFMYACRDGAAARAVHPYGPQPGDADADGDVDLDDLAGLVTCLSGPDALPSPEPGLTLLECLETFDNDADNDVDATDVAAFQRAFEGSETP
jgi:WD40 repeat protein